MKKRWIQVLLLLFLTGSLIVAYVFSSHLLKKPHSENPLQEMPLPYADLQIMGELRAEDRYGTVIVQVFQDEEERLYYHVSEFFAEDNENFLMRNNPSPIPELLGEITGENKDGTTTVVIVERIYGRAVVRSRWIGIQGPVEVPELIQ